MNDLHFDDSLQRRSEHNIHKVIDSTEPMVIKVSGKGRYSEAVILFLGILVFPIAAMYFGSDLPSWGALMWSGILVAVLCTSFFYLCTVWFIDSLRRFESDFRFESDKLIFDAGKRSRSFELKKLLIRTRTRVDFRPAELGFFDIVYDDPSGRIPAPAFWVNGSLARFKFLLESHKRGATVEDLALVWPRQQVLTLPSGPKGVFGYLDSLIAGVVLTVGVGLGISFGLLVQIASVAILSLIIWSILRNKFWIKHKQRRVEIIEEAFRISRGENILHEIPMSQVLGVVVETQSEFLRSPRYRLCFKTAYSRMVPVSDWSKGEEVLLLNFAAHMIDLGIPIEVESEKH